jgi:hypothetical protein
MILAYFRHIAAVLIFLSLNPLASAEIKQYPPKPFPYREKLEYSIEWRLITAGMAQIDVEPTGPNWETKLNIESAGMVTRLYRVNDTYRALANNQFCGIHATLDAEEGKRHRFSSLSFDGSKKKVAYEERDLVKNKTTQKTIDIAPCTHEIVGALSALRMMRVEPGKTVMLPITDGKKMVMARVEAQQKETIEIDKKEFQTIRYEAFLFDNVLYRRKGRLWVWMTDDASRLPVQIRVRLGFPIGNITLTLDKDERP